MYFNIYALAHPVNGVVGLPEEAVWIGTSAEGRTCAFWVVWKSLRELLGLGNSVRKGKVRFYVQGVTDCGVAGGRGVFMWMWMWIGMLSWI